MSALNGVYSSIVAYDVTRKKTIKLTNTFVMCDATSGCGFAVLAVLG